MPSKTTAFALLALVIGTVPLAPGDLRADDAKGRVTKPSRGVLGTAAEAGTFRTLINAVVAADLFDALREDGPFTVFAPTDEAFAKLPADDLAAVLKRENKDALRKLLTLHVVPGRLTSEMLTSHGSPRTLNGARLTMMDASRKSPQRGRVLGEGRPHRVAPEVECPPGEPLRIAPCRRFRPGELARAKHAWHGDCQ